MFKFLSFFRKSSDEQQNDNEYDFHEAPAPAEVQGPESQTTVRIDSALGPTPKPPAESHQATASRKLAEKTRITAIEDELSAMSGDPHPPLEEQIDANNSPFFKEGPITEDEKTEPITAFGFRLEPSMLGQEPGNANFSSNNETGVVTINAHFPKDIRDELTPEQIALFDVSDDGKSVSYPKKEQEDEPPSAQASTHDKKPATEGYKAPPMMDEMPSREFPENERDAEILTADRLAEMIHDTPGEELVIYTGAGISKGGGKPVWDMNELQRNLQVDTGSDQFLQALIKDPEALSEAFKSFAQQINTPNPTLAHEAITAIMEAKPGATLMTQNGDRNHEASGVRPIHVAALPEFYEFLKGRTDKASLIVTAGLHADELSFLNWVATKNPNVRIAAVDLGRSIATYPSYLDKDDYILPGDAQKTLPDVARDLKNKQVTYDGGPPQSSGPEQDGGEQSFRLQGELERAHPDIEPLPPAPITSEAKKRLESWGMPESFINRLQELTSSMRYDLCPQKAERIAQNGGYIYETNVGEEEIVLPDFFNNRGRLDGQCSDIALQFVDILYTSGYIGEIRTKMAETGQPPLNPCFVRGLSPTHFNNQTVRDRSWSHVWTGLLPEGGELEDMVTIDPSFQEISNNGENGYQIMESLVDPSGTSLDIAASCHVGEVEVSEGGFQVKGGFKPLTLGSSSDGAYVYGFSFVKDNFDKYHPVLVAQTEDGGTGPSCMGDVNGTVMFANEQILTTEQRAEMEAVCSTLAGINLVRDQDEAYEHLVKTATVSFEEAKT